VRIIRDKRGRKIFNKHINKYRIMQLKEMEKDAYANMKELMLLLLDELQKDQDSENAMKALTIADTYFMFSPGPHG
jgi:hypothetical protein